MHTLFKFSVLLLSIVFFNISSYAQESKTDTIKVFGNCNMCKEKIEGSLKEKDGITAKNWDKKTKLLVVTYDAAKISKEQIGQKIADVGYDNQYIRNCIHAVSTTGLNNLPVMKINSHATNIIK